MGKAEGHDEANGGFFLGVLDSNMSPRLFTFSKAF